MGRIRYGENSAEFFFKVNGAEFKLCADIKYDDVRMSIHNYCFRGDERCELAEIPSDKIATLNRLLLRRSFMGGGMMSGVCNVCGTVAIVDHHYKHYTGVRCKCHGKDHFQICTCCSKCKPVFDRFHILESDQFILMDGYIEVDKFKTYKEAKDELDSRTERDNIAQGKSKDQRGRWKR